MTAHWVLASIPAVCVVCARSRRMRLVLPRSSVSLRVECPHCQPPRIPIVNMPNLKESPRP